MRPLIVHYSLYTDSKGRQYERMAACGVFNARHKSSSAESVTCQRCLRIMKKKESAEPAQPPPVSVSAQTHEVGIPDVSADDSGRVDAPSLTARAQRLSDTSSAGLGAVTRPGRRRRSVREPQLDAKAAAARENGRKGGRPRKWSQAVLEAAAACLRLHALEEGEPSLRSEFRRLAEALERGELRLDAVKRAVPPPSAPAATSPPPKKRIRVELWLRVERNNKFVRGRKRALAEIERDVLRRFDMVKPEKDGWEYILTIPYETDEELDKIIIGLMNEAELIADDNRCFTEAHVTSVDDPDRSW